MIRSKDLDKVAPDDPIAPASKPSPSALPVITPLKQKVYDIAGHATSPLSPFLVNPKKITFAEKNDGEEILIALRSHWFTNVSWILITILMSFAPSFLRYVPLLNSFPPSYQFIAVLFWYLVAFAFAFEKFLAWYFDISLITNRRVVDIDFNNLLDKKFSEADLRNIQDVSSQISGVSQTIFNYGTVLIQTASEVNVIIFEKVPNPNKIIKVLQELRSPGIKNQ